MNFNKFMNKLLDTLSNFLARYPGVLPMVGVLLILLNLILQIFPGPGSGWFVDSNLFLHVGLLVAVIGLMLARAVSRG